MFVCKFQTQFNQFNISIYSGNEQDLFQLNRYRGQNEAQLTISARQNILDYEVPENRLRILQVSKAYCWALGLVGQSVASLGVASLNLARSRTLLEIVQ